MLHRGDSATGSRPSSAHRRLRRGQGPGRLTPPGARLPRRASCRGRRGAPDRLRAVAGATRARPENTRAARSPAPTVAPGHGSTRGRGSGSRARRVGRRAESRACRLRCRRGGGRLAGKLARRSAEGPVEAVGGNSQRLPPNARIHGGALEGCVRDGTVRCLGLEADDRHAQWDEARSLADKWPHRSEQLDGRELRGASAIGAQRRSGSPAASPRVGGRGLEPDGGAWCDTGEANPNRRVEQCARR